MNTSQKSILILTALASSSLLDAAIDLGRGTLITDINVVSEYTNNAQQAANGEEDWINTLTPTLIYQSYGTEWQTNASLGVSFLSYSNQNQDNENINFSASASHPRGISFSGGVSETTGGDSEFGQVVSTRNYSFSATISYKLTPKIPVSTGFSYSLRQPLDDSNGIQRNETESISIPFNISIPIHDKITVGYAFGMQQTNGQNGGGDSKSTTHSVFASVTDDIFPRVTGNLSLGAQMRLSDQGDQFSPYASGGLSWQAGALTSVSMNLSAGFQNTTGNRINRNMSISLGLNHKFPRNVSGNISAGLSSNEYADIGQAEEFTRKDTSWNIGAGLSTTVYEHTNLMLSLNYSRSNSDQSNSQFNSYSIRFSANRPF
ncbi:MAG: outer membrane beta-barrel protein [Opitutales bacterium]